MYNIIQFINNFRKDYQIHVKFKEYIRKKSMKLLKNKKHKELIYEFQNKPEILSEIIKYQYNSDKFDKTYFTEVLKEKNYKKYIKNKINMYDNLINKSIKLNKDIMVYRGELRNNLNLKKNDIYEPGTFMSTSLDMSHAYGFFPGNLISLKKDIVYKEKKGCCFYKIIIPKNNPIFYLTYKKLFDKMEENEILLNYTNKYLVIDKYEKHNIIFYTLLIINKNKHNLTNLNKLLNYDKKIFENIYKYFQINANLLNQYNKLKSTDNNFIFNQLYFFNNYDGKSNININKYKLDKLKEFDYDFKFNKYQIVQKEYIKSFLNIDDKYINNLKLNYKIFDKFLQKLNNQISIYQIFYGNQKIRNKRYLIYTNYIIKQNLINYILKNDIININNYFIGTLSLLGILGIPEVTYLYKKHNYNTSLPDFLMQPTKNKLDNLIPKIIIKYNIKKNTKYICNKNFTVLNEMLILIDKNLKFKKKNIININDLNNNKIKIIELDQIK